MEAIIENTRIRELVREVAEIIQRYLGKGRSYSLYLFGSRLKNRALEGADIDLALSCPDLSESDFRKIKREIENIRTLHSIDLIHLERVDADFREIVLSDAVKIDG